VDLLNDIEGVHCIKPNATFYLWPNVTGAMKKRGLTNYDAFRRTVLQETGVSFCTRLHFGRPLEGENNYYIRMAYSGINSDEIKEGLGKFKAFIES
jgi:aspartate/methionine/tyrosine aminotransferase